MNLAQLSGLSPLKKDNDPTQIPEDSLIIRQQFNESRFKSDAVSPAGAISVAQITEDTFNDGLKKGYVPKGTKFEDLAKNDKLATQFQKNYMTDLLNRSWNKGNDKVKRAKALAAYNMGPTRLVEILNKMRADGIDIENNNDWVNHLPEYHRDRKTDEPIFESRNYVQNVLFGGDDSYEEEFDRLYMQKYGNIEELSSQQISGLSQ
jgi:soluble lytic murein transglycosylase-like protein